MTEPTGLPGAVAGTVRLDCALVDLGLVGTRAKAQRLVRAGAVRVGGPDGRVETKPSAKVLLVVNSDGNVVAAEDLVVNKGDDYVSRGALKLEGAFAAFGEGGTLEASGELAAADALKPAAGLRCLDIGASTGGFCDVLLRRGAVSVIALDVGHGQLDPRIAGDARIIEMSGVNIRDVTAGDLPYRPELIVSDVSFISLTYVLPVAAAIAADGAQMVFLVKPQFEVGREHLGKNGIVTDESCRLAALDKVTACARANGLTVLATAPSPIEGTHGNAEYLMLVRKPQDGQ
ncbi:TlyA family RNA methyltransferase [Bifidobacterium choloepi]|uniref:TlyA family RNA methyltransferase n=1 Tax=Bifidobacterium choloepi TaxID=2614131 RepID=A0A6I5MZZ8_9BIFI|nr:TlyA family RNA methyltransferase [Bifidobacterium choloepi]NEG70248.1 TlyA family RNA methyltransferase [Bifidobacterium choloepi]